LAQASPMALASHDGSAVASIHGSRILQETLTVRELESLFGRLSQYFPRGQIKNLLEAIGCPTSPDDFVRLHDFCNFLYDECIGHRFRGVSIDHLEKELLCRVQEQGQSREAKVYEIEPTVIRPKGARVQDPSDGRFGASYVDSIYGKDNAGVADFMLSYTWGYEIGDIIDTLLAFSDAKALQPKTTYVWICCLCINQHRVKEAQASGEVVPFTTFQHAFG